MRSCSLEEIERMVEQVIKEDAPAQAPSPTITITTANTVVIVCGVSGTVNVTPAPAQRETALASPTEAQSRA